MRSLCVFTLLVCLSAALFACREKEATACDKWPSKSIKLIVPFNTGGGLDASARLLAKYWEKELGVKIAVENRGGANGQIGTTYFMGLPDDGSNVLMSAQLFYSANIIVQNAPFSIDDLAVLNALESDPDSLRSRSILLTRPLKN